MMVMMHRLLQILLLCLLVPGLARAACVDDGAGTYTCSGDSTNVSTQTGNTIIDTSGGDATLNNREVVGVSRGIIQNDTGATTGQMQTIEVTGAGHADIQNISGLISVERANLNTSLFGASATGILLYNGTQAGLASAIHAGYGVSLLSLTAQKDAAFLNARGDINAKGSFAAAIAGNADQIEIKLNNGAGIFHQDSDTSTDTFQSGHWAVATYGGATYTAPSILDGTHYADVTSAGLTRIDIALGGGIYGDVLVVDANPLLKAAQTVNPGLQLAYGVEDVGPRDSVINVLRSGAIRGNIYLGSGAHVINNGVVLGADAGSTIYGNIYVDQSATAVTSVSGGVATPEYLVAGARTFTFNQMGQFTGNITINDVAESVNNINIYAGYSDNTSYESSNPDFNITTNGLGVNNLSIDCALTKGAAGCHASGNWLGLSSLNVRGGIWDFSSATQVINVSGGSINLDAQRVVFGGKMIADEVIVNTLLTGVLESESAIGAPPAQPDRIGTITGHLINNGDIVVRDATLTVDGDATFNSGSSFSLRINNTSNGMLAVTSGTGNGIFTDGSKIILTTKDKFFHTGDTFTVATNSSGTPIIQDSIGIVNFTSSDASGNIVLTANVSIPTALNTNAAGNNAVNLLMDYAGNDPLLVKLQQDIQTLDEVELKRAVERLRPEINDSLIRMTMTHTDRVLGVVESHLFDTYLASVKGEPRVPVDGKLPTGSGIWFQGFGGMGTQDTRKNVDGYISSSTGMAAGIDRLIGDGDDLRVGFAGAYAYGNIDNSGITDNNRTNVNSYLALAYGAWTPAPWYLNGAVGIARHTYATERIALGRNATGNHASMQFTAKVDAGWPIEYNDLLTFVPLASFSYNRINEDGYEEHGTEKIEGGGLGWQGVPNMIDVDSAINLRIDKKTYNSYRGGMGGKILLSLQQPDYNAGVEMRAMYVHEFGDLTNDSTAQFTHGGPVFYSPGIKPANGGIILGTSVRLTGNDDNDQLTLLASYDADIRDKYFGQSLTLMLRYDFDQGPSYIKKAEFRKAAAIARTSHADKPVAATDRDIAEIATAMAGHNSLDDMLELELNSEDVQVRQNAQKKKAVKLVLDNWINAMINSNETVYFNTYAADFVNEFGMTRQQWERKRRQEMKDGNPAISISDLTISPHGKSVSTVFSQVSLQDGKQEAVQKILELEERNGRWFIVAEDTLPLLSFAAATPSN